MKAQLQEIYRHGTRLYGPRWSQRHIVADMIRNAR
jgi:hypothetical protein